MAILKKGNNESTGFHWLNKFPDLLLINVYMLL